MIITQKILISVWKCYTEKCVYLPKKKKKKSLIQIYDFQKFSLSFIKFTEIQSKVVGFLKPAGFEISFSLKKNNIFLKH